MTDEQFVKRLLQLSSAGKSGIPEMREVLRGQMSRLIELAARGLGVREAKIQRELSKCQIPDDFPDQTAKAAALEYWSKKRRPDLMARVDEIAEQFHTHHFVRNNRFVAWAMVWKTWYFRSVSHEKPPRDMPLMPVATVIPLDVATWVRRLRIFYFGDEANGVEVGFWSPKWGLPPGPGCSAPAEALAEFQISRQKSLGL